MVFQKIKKFYYFIYYCNFRILDSIASKNMKNSPIHGWTWPMFIIIINLGIIDQLFTTAIFSDSNSFYFIGIYLCLAIFNFYTFTYKDKHTLIIKECNSIPYHFRYFGVTFFAIYSILSLITLLVVIFAGWHIQF